VCLSPDTQNSQGVKLNFYDVVKLVFNLVLAMAERNLISDHIKCIAYLIMYHILNDFSAFNALVLIF